MRTREFGDETILYIPDIMPVFSNGWLRLTDTSGEVKAIRVSGYGVSETREIFNGEARVNVLPFARATQSNDGDLFATHKYSRQIDLFIELLDENGDPYADGEETIDVIYGGQGIEGSYGGDRWITYNPAVTESAITISVNGSTSVDMGESTMEITQFGVTQNENLRQWLGANPEPGTHTLTFDPVNHIKGDDVVSRVMTLHATIDNRKTNIVNLRWVDTEGKVNYRTFAKGTETQTTHTASQYSRPVYNRAMVDGIDRGDDTWVNREIGNALTFGDNAIPANQYAWLCSLLAASIVEMKIADGWQRVNVADASFAHETKANLFNFSASLALPNTPAQQW